MSIFDHEEHKAEWLRCLNCAEKYCKQCSDAGTPQVFCCSFCEELYRQWRRIA